jgi:hypothetical protein
MTTSAAPAGCPRCRAADVRPAAASPVPGRWVLHACHTCWYVWRSTEPPAATDADRYPRAFRLDATDLTAAPRMV